MTSNCCRSIKIVFLGCTMLVAFACDGRGYTPLIRAALKNDPELTARLLEGGADVNTCAGGPGWTTSPLAAAAGSNHVEVVKKLLAAGANPDLVCGVNTPLSLAVNNGSLEALRLLIGKGSNTVRLSGGGWTYLMQAAISVQPDTVPILVAAGCPIEARLPSNGETALMIASGWDPKPTLALIKAGADVNARDSNGATPLIHAMRGAIYSATHGPTAPGKWDPSIVTILLEAGGDPNLADSAGRRPLQLASKAGPYAAEITKLLTLAGAT